MRNTFSGVWNVHVLASLHTGKARVWHAAGVRPVTCDWLERESVLEDAGLVWRGSDVSTFQQGFENSRHTIGDIPILSVFSWSIHRFHTT